VKTQFNHFLKVGWRVATLVVVLALVFGAGAARAQTVTLHIGAGQDASTVPLKDMIQSGMADQALGFHVEWDEFPYDALYTKLVQNGQTNSSDFDVIMMDDPWIPQFSASGYLSDMTAMGYTPDDDFVPNTLALGYWPPQSGPRVPGIAADDPSELYSLPVIGDTQIFFYRKDLISEAPQTWDDINHIAETQADPANNVYALAMRGVKGNPIVTEWFPYLYSYGGAIFDDQWHVTVNSPEGVAALQEFVDLMKYEPPGVANFDSAQQGACYLQGECLMNIEWTGWVLSAEDPAQSQVVGKTGWTTTPEQVRHASQIGNWMIGIAAGSTQQDDALKLMQWLVSPEAQRELANRKGVPVKVSVYTDATLDEQYPWLPVIHDALDNSIARPRTPDWAQVESTLGLHLNNAVTGTEGVQEALDNAAKEITDLLTGLGYYPSS
jgi:multiple sugar transport system substrate-binding protein